jgi:5-methylcytosine-specific restriction endonuclease McrA
MKSVSYVNHRFGRLIALEKIRIEPKGRFWYLCQCDCGKQIKVSYSNLKTGSTRSCGCLRKETISALKRKDDFQIISNGMFSYYKKNARDRNISFLLPKESFISLLRKSCFFCGSKGSTYYANKYHTRTQMKVNGVDRLDNSKGYTEENSVSCCKICNRAKGDLTLEEFKEWLSSAYFYSNKNKEVKEPIGGVV